MLRYQVNSQKKCQSAHPKQLPIPSTSPLLPEMHNKIETKKDTSQVE